LKNLERTAVLLHPRHSEEPGEDRSKLGGIFCWPADEAWPHCVEHHVPFAPILQLRRDEFPELEFKAGTNLMQLLWCPGERLVTKWTIVWRDRSSVRRVRAKIPTAENAFPGNLPLPCRLFPERVVEYPDYYELPREIKERLPSRAPDAVVADFKETRRDHDEKTFHEGLQLYSDVFQNNYWGIKLGGWPRWLRDPQTVQCSRCHMNMDYVLQLGAGEQWPMAPEQEQQLVKARVECNERIALENALNAPGFQLAGDAVYYFFVCRRCEPWEVGGTWQML
jgi:hypothetical protein